MTDNDEMADGDDDDVSRDELDQLNAKVSEAEQSRQALEQSGWVWRGDTANDKLLCHPDDPEINIWFNPYSGEQLLSPKLVEHLKRQAQNDSQRLSN